MYTVSDEMGKGIFMPEEVAWDFFIKDTVLESIHSKNKRKFLRKLPDILHEQQLHEEILAVTDDIFLQWLSFYEQVQKLRGYKMLAKRDWLIEKEKKGRQAELLLLKKNDQWVGAKMYSYGPHGIYFAFKSTHPSIDHSFSPGLILDYLSFERAKQLGYSMCKMGREASIHGISSSLSLYEYKVSMGYHIRSAENTKYVRVLFPKVPLSSTMVFLAGKKGQEKMYYIYTDQNDLQYVNKEKPVNKEIISLSYAELLEFQEKYE